MLHAASDSGDRETIKEAVQAVVQLSPKDFEFRKKLAKMLVDEGFYAEAIRIYETVLKTHPADRPARNQLVKLYQWTGQLKKAADFWAHASDRNPEGFELAISAGTAYTEAGFIDAAIAYFQRALKIRPDHIPVRKKLATYYSWIDETDKMAEELEYLDAAGRLEEEQKRILAQVYLDRKLWFKAIEQLKHWRHQSRLPVEIGWMLAEAYIGTDQRSLAAKILIRMGRENPKDPNLLTRLAQELLGLENRESALELFEAVLSSDAEKVVALKAIAEIYARMGDFGSAIRHLEKYCRKVSDDYEAHYQLAELYFNKGRNHKAHNQYKKALTLIKRSRRRENRMLQ
jgi:tetratricopeptide (TPR) repeat protein